MRLLYSSVVVFNWGPLQFLPIAKVYVLVRGQFAVMGLQKEPAINT
jgi:hypothetical protein